MCRKPSEPSVTCCPTLFTNATRKKLSPPSLKLLDLNEINIFICLMIIRITLEPTNDEAVHILSPWCPGWWCLVESWKSHGFWVVLCMWFRWLLVFWIYLFIYLNYPSLVTGCLIVAALSTDSLSMTWFAIPLSKVTNLSISIIPLWSFFLSDQ